MFLRTVTSDPHPTAVITFHLRSSLKILFTRTKKIATTVKIKTMVPLPLLFQREMTRTMMQLSLQKETLVSREIPTLRELPLHLLTQHDLDAEKLRIEGL
jgi:hypothetical protein